MILCVERFRDFGVLRGCVIFSLAHSGCMIHFFFAERLRDIFVESLHDFFVKRLHDLLCE